MQEQKKNKSKKSQQNIKQSPKKSILKTQKSNSNMRTEFLKLNTFDLREFLDNGGQIKDLINRPVFLKIFKEIQLTLKKEEERK